MTAVGRFQTVWMGKSGWFTSALRRDSPSGAADAKSLRAMQCVPLHGVAMGRMTCDAGADRHPAEGWDTRHLLPYPSPNAGPTLVCHGQSHASCRWRRRKAAARSAPHRRQRHRCSVRSMRRFSGVNGCPLPQQSGIYSPRTLGGWISEKQTRLLLVDSNPAPATICNNN